jgi:hypothetical protein
MMSNKRQSVPPSGDGENAMRPDTKCFYICKDGREIEIGHSSFEARLYDSSLSTLGVQYGDGQHVPIQYIALAHFVWIIADFTDMLHNPPLVMANVANTLQALSDLRFPTGENVYRFALFSARDGVIFAIPTLFTWQRCLN